MPLQPFEPIAETFDGAEIEPLKAYKVMSELEGPIITAAWSLTSIVIAVELQYHLRQYVSNKPAYEQLAKAIEQSKKAQESLESQKAQQSAAIIYTEEVRTERAREYEAGPTRPLYIAVLEATADLGTARADLAATESAITQTAGERAKLTRELAEFGFSDAKDALRRSEFPLLIIARLVFEDEVIWTRSLDTQRLLLGATARFSAESSGGDYTGIEGLYQERSEATYDVAGDLTPGKPLRLEFEVLGPTALEGPDLEGPEIAAGATLTAPDIAIVYEPERAPAVN